MHSLSGEYQLQPLRRPAQFSNYTYPHAPCPAHPGPLGRVAACSNAEDTAKYPAVSRSLTFVGSQFTPFQLKVSFRMFDISGHSPPQAEGLGQALALTGSALRPRSDGGRQKPADPNAPPILIADYLNASYINLVRAAHRVLLARFAAQGAALLRRRRRRRPSFSVTPRRCRRTSCHIR